MYWGPGSVPELKGLEKQQQRELYTAATQEGLKRIGGWQAHLWLAVPVAIVMLIVRLGGFSGMVNAVIYAALTAAIALFLGNRIMDKGREWLRDQGYPKN